MVICYSCPKKLIQGACRICFCRPNSYCSQVSTGDTFAEKWFDNWETKLDILVWKLEKHLLNVTSEVVAFMFSLWNWL